MALTSRDVKATPLSQDVIHKKIISAVREVKDVVPMFQDFYLSEVRLNPERALKSLEALCKAAGRDFENLEDIKDVKELLLIGDQNEAIAGSGFKSICSMQDRGEEFEYISFSLKNTVLDAYEHFLVKYCLSFEPQANGQQIDVVDEYEDKILKWKEYLQARADRVQECTTEYQHYKKNFTKYIQNYSQVVEVMREVCALLLDMCGPMKSWVQADANYGKLLLEEITRFNRLKQETQDKLLQLLDRRELQSQATKNKHFTLVRLHKQLEHVNERNRNFHRRHADLAVTTQRHAADLGRKRKDVKEAKGALKPSGTKVSRPLQNYMLTVTETLKDETRQLAKRKETGEAMLNKLRGEGHSIREQIEDVEAEMVRQKHLLDEIFAGLEKMDLHLQRLRENQQAYEDKLRVLKMIRELKLNSTTIKRLHNLGSHPGHHTTRDELQEAMKITALSIGKDWKALYHNLPFDHPRDFLTRDLDIDRSRGSTWHGFKSRQQRCRVREFPGGMYPQNSITVHASLDM